MRKLLAVALLATSTAVSAAADRAIYDIMYLPNAGTTYGFTDFTYETSQKEFSDDSELDINGLRLSQTLGHSFTDRLSVQADINYFDGRWDNRPDQNYDQSGLSDLGVNAKFRVMDENIRLDIIGGAQIELQDAEAKTDEISNNYLTGGNRLNAGLQVGGKGDWLQWAVLGRYFYNMERTIETSGRDLDLDPNDSLQLRADLLNKFTEKSFLRSHVTADFIQQQDIDGGGSFQGAQTNYELGLEYQYMFSQDFLGRFGADYQVRNYDSSQTDKDDNLNYRIAFNYQF